jgi:TRAP-type C4-dicarboxylate transport system substrate-binding protein
MTVNLDAWNALDDATRARLEAIGRETTARNWQALTGRVEVNYARMRENGMRIVEQPQPSIAHALAQAGADAVTRWAERAGDEGRAILAAFRAR